MKKLLALILALGLVFAPMAIAGTQDDEVSVGGYTTRTVVTLLYNLVTALNETNAGSDDNIALLNNWNVLLKELASDADTNRLAFGNWEIAVEEIGADIDAMKVALGNWQTEIQASANIETLILIPNLPPALTASATLTSVAPALTANVTPANVTAPTVTDSAIGSGTKADPSVSTTI